MNGQSIGILGATSMVGQRLIQQGITQNYHITAFSRQSIDRDQAHVDWQQLPSITDKEMDCENKTIPYWVCVAPIWTLPDYFDFLLTFKLQRIVVLSSTSRFTKHNSAELNEQVIAQKLIEGEKLLESWANSHAIQWIILRPTLIYGYGQDKNITAIAQFIERYGFFPVLGEANGLRQPIHSDDVTAACFSALWAHHITNHAYNLTGGETLSYRQMVERIFAALNRTARIITIPLWLFRIATAFMNHLPRYRHWNIAMATRMNQNLVFEAVEAKRDLNFSAKPFRLETKDLPRQTS